MNILHFWNLSIELINCVHHIKHDVDVNSTSIATGTNERTNEPKRTDGTEIQFTRKIEEDGKLPFLNCLVSRNNNELRTTLYRKRTHAGRLLDESSYNPTSQKATTIKTLTRPAQLVCDTPDSSSDESKYLGRVLTKAITTLTLLDETLIRLLTLQKLTETRHLSRLQLLFRTSKALLRLSRASYYPGGLLDILFLGGEVRPGPSNPDPV